MEKYAISLAKKRFTSIHSPRLGIWWDRVAYGESSDQQNLESGISERIIAFLENTAICDLDFVSR